VIAIAHAASERVNAPALTACIQEAIRMELAPESPAQVSFELVQSAA